MGISDKTMLDKDLGEEILELVNLFWFIGCTYFTH